MKKQQLPDWFPKHGANPRWNEVNCGAFTEPVFSKIKAELNKLGSHSYRPAPQELFYDFSINPDNIKLVIVNSQYPMCVRKKEDGTYPPYTEYPDVQKKMWDVLQNEYGWTEGAEYFTSADLSDWVAQGTLLLNLSLTNVRKDIWKEFMIKLFQWFNETGERYVFCFLDNESFSNYAKFVKDRHEIVYLFQPKLIEELLVKQHGGFSNFFGLPF